MVVCTPTKKAWIVDMRERGMKFTEIAQKGLPRSTISRNHAKMLKNSNLYAKAPGRGRPTKMTARSVRQAVRACDNGTARDATDVKQQLFPELSVRTVQRHLLKAGLPGRIRRKSPYLKLLHRYRQYRWAKERAHWTVEDWNWVWFSDESKFQLFGSDGKQYCRRRPGEEYLDRNVKSTVKHGGGRIMVWGCITPWGHRKTAPH